MKRKYIRPAMGAVRMELTSIINGRLPALFSFICPPTRRVAYFFTFLLFYFFTFLLFQNNCVPLHPENETV